jgi:hypothetical protein
MRLGGPRVGDDLLAVAFEKIARRPHRHQTVGLRDEQFAGRRQ